MKINYTAIFTAVAIIFGGPFLGSVITKARAQPQPEARSLPLTAPADPVMQAYEKKIVKLTMQLEASDEALRQERITQGQLMPKQSYPDFLVFRAIGDGDWKMSSRDTNYAFAVKAQIQGTNYTFTVNSVMILK